MAFVKKQGILRNKTVFINPAEWGYHLTLVPRMQNIAQGNDPILTVKISHNNSFTTSIIAYYIEAWSQVLKDAPVKAYHRQWLCKDNNQRFKVAIYYQLLPLAKRSL